MENAEKLDMIIPVELGTDSTAFEVVVGSIMEQNQLFGFTKFALSTPEKGWRSVSYPPKEFFVEQAQRFLKVKNALPPHIRCGWWHTLILKSGPTPDLTRIVREDGTEAPFSTCPLDPEYRRRFTEDVAAFLKICRPDFMFTEDDFGLNCHGGPGCYCQYHLEEFAKREGRFYSREELRELFKGSRVGSRELLRRFKTLQKDSLVQFAEAIRAAADSVMPELPIGYDQPGCSVHDGNSVEAVARALAGKNHTPWSRFFGTFYGPECIPAIPSRLFNCLYFKQHIKGDFTFYHESDSYPHTRFYNSAGNMRTLMSSAYSYGYDGSVFQTQQCLDDPGEEKVFAQMFADERVRFNALHEKVKQCTVCGVQLHHDPFDAANFPKQGPAWLEPVTFMGIPYTTDEDSAVAFISGNQLQFADEETIIKYLSKGVFLDGLAAKVLCERGYGSYLGVDVKSLLLEGNEKFDFCSREVIREPFVPESKGRTMVRGDGMVFCPNGNGDIYRLEVTDPACGIVTEIVSFRHEVLGPGMTRFQNKLGGKVVIWATDVSMGSSSSLLNYRRQKLFQELLMWCSDPVPYVKNVPRMYLIVNKAPEDCDHFGVLTCSNLCPDPLEKLELHLPQAWLEKSAFRIMDENGLWQKADVEKTCDGIILNKTLEYTRPVYLLVEKEN